MIKENNKFLSLPAKNVFMIGFVDLEAPRVSWREPFRTSYAYDPNQLYVIDGRRRIVETENPLYRVKKLAEL